MSVYVCWYGKNVKFQNEAYYHTEGNDSDSFRPLRPHQQYQTSICPDNSFPEVWIHCPYVVVNVSRGGGQGLERVSPNIHYRAHSHKTALEVVHCWRPKITCCSKNNRCNCPTMTRALFTSSSLPFRCRAVSTKEYRTTELRYTRLHLSRLQSTFVVRDALCRNHV